MNAYSVSIEHHQLSSDSGTSEGIWKSSDGKHPDERETKLSEEGVKTRLELRGSGLAKRTEGSERARRKRRNILGG